MVYDPFEKVAQDLLDKVERVGIKLTESIEDLKNTEKCKISFEFSDKEERDRFLTLVTFGWSLYCDITDFEEYIRKLYKYSDKEEVNINELRDQFYNSMESLDKFREV